MADSEPSAKLTSLPFPPLQKSHILNCSYHSWYPQYRSLTPKARLVALSEPFIRYLRADGIVLPNENEEQERLNGLSDSDSGIFSGTDNEDDGDDTEELADPAAEWRDIHENITRTIAALGGKIVPKLNWSAPKDATWISATNSMECVSPNDVYLLLKSSDFITHDLEHAFDGCVEDETSKDITVDTLPYHLVLRKHFQLNPSLEFRCFVRRKKLIAICQRDLNHFDFLFNLQHGFREKIQAFFEDKLLETFPDENFAFDVYIPPPHDRVWLIDINPWAMRTDPLLFSWLELLTMSDGSDPSLKAEDEESETNTDEDVESVEWRPIFRLVNKDDPEAYGFASPQFSAHKLPKDVVDASRGGESELRDFADRWKELVERSQSQQGADSEDD